jgi:cysteinyl-tRNA synthetase
MSHEIVYPELTFMQINALVMQREAALQSGDVDLADSIIDQLKERAVELDDASSQWHAGDGRSGPI